MTIEFSRGKCFKLFDYTEDRKGMMTFSECTEKYTGSSERVGTQKAHETIRRQVTQILFQLSC